ncbi:MAG: GspH/FimT family pseudopilin [Steroidobacteraceae bacterium]
MRTICVPPARVSGATAWELTLVLLVVATLWSMAVPAFTRLRQNAALTAAANQMLLALHYARSLAITRGVAVGVCQSQDGARCAVAGASSVRFLVFINGDSDQPAQRDAGEELMRAYEIAPTLSLRGTRAAINYWPAPRAGTTTTFAFCDSRRAAAPRAVIVSQTGRPRLARTAADGGALACP